MNPNYVNKKSQSTHNSKVHRHSNILTPHTCNYSSHALLQQKNIKTTPIFPQTNKIPKSQKKQGSIRFSSLSYAFSCIIPTIFLTFWVSSFFGFHLEEIIGALSYSFKKWLKPTIDSNNHKRTLPPFLSLSMLFISPPKLCPLAPSCPLSTTSI